MVAAITTATGKVIATTTEAYALAKDLCEEYEKRKKQEKEQNVRKEAEHKVKEKTDADEEAEGPSRTVTDIDYEKHEQTVRELERQEEEEEFMRKRQEASQWCTLDHEHGPHCKQPIHGCSHDHQKEWAIYEKSTEEKIRAADRFRQEGNEAYRNNNYGLAAVHYRKALLQFDYTFANTPEEEKSLEEVKLPCLLNLAACKCQQEEWDEVLTQCRLALELNPRSVKAYYRTGLAHLSRDQFDLARDALMSAHEIEPKNKEVLTALRKLKDKMANYKVRQKEVYKAMTTNAEEEEDAANGTTGDNRSHDNSATAEEAPSDAQAPAEPASTQETGVAPSAKAEGADASSDAAAEPPAEPAEADEADAGAAGHLVQEGSCAADHHSDEGLRRRQAIEKAIDETLQEEEEKDDIEDEKSIEAAQKRVLNCIFITAGCLAVIAMSGVAMLVYAGDS